MIIDNVKVNGTLCSIHIENHKIAKIEKAGQKLTAADIDGGGARIIPGMIDVHTHGRMGIDAMDCRFEELCAAYAKVGTTSFLATTMCMEEDEIRRVTDTPLPKERGEAHLLGFHLEGPYLAESYCGAQNVECMVDPSMGNFALYKHVKMITVAPERKGALEFIAEASKKCIVSLGHTGCTCQQAMDAMDQGANCLTHMFNAMAPLHHRETGPIGAAILKQPYVQLICDGTHVYQPAVVAAFRLFPGKVVLISDSILPAGLPDGICRCGGLKVIMKDGKACLSNGTIAGSTATLLDCVRKAIEFGIPEKDAIDAATRVPAQMLGLNKGRIEVGYDADLLLVDEQLHLIRTIIA